MGTATYADTVIVKTVYDPNPAGFKMPPSNAWTRFSLTGGNTRDLANINASNVGIMSRDHGFKFYTQDDGKGQIVFHQFIGSRQRQDGRLMSVGSSGTYISAMAETIERGLGLAFEAAGLYPFVGAPKSSGIAIRPITD
jgi:hypothetical protein